MFAIERMVESTDHARPTLLFCLGHQDGRQCCITLECKEKVNFFRSGSYAMLYCLAPHEIKIIN